MNVMEFELGYIQYIKFTVATESKWFDAGKEVDFEGLSDGFTLIDSESSYSCPIVEIAESDKAVLCQYLESPDTVKYICIIDSVMSDRVIVRMHRFDDVIDLKGTPLTIRYRDVVERHVRKYLRPSKGVTIQEALTSEFSLFGKYYFMTNQFHKGRAINLISRRRYLEFQQDSNDYAASNLIQTGLNQYIPMGLTVFVGEIEFVDDTFEARRENSVSFDQIIKEKEGVSSYLKLWDEYNRINHKILIEEAVMLGTMKWTKIVNLKPESGFRYRFHVDMVNSELLYKEVSVANMDIEAIMSKGNPDILMNPDSGFLEKHIGKVIKIDLIDRCITVVSGEPIDKDKIGSFKFIQKSMRGEQVVIERRIEAKDKIINNDILLHSLPELIERGKTENTPELEMHKPITRKTERMLSGKVMNQEQTDAIRAALNTPDIALIQGPPGTGKTSVIRALISRIEQIYDEKMKGDDSQEGCRILITSFQHDAVDNAIVDLDTSGLPADRHGGRKGEVVDGYTKYRHWIEERLDFVDEKLEMHPKSDLEKVYLELEARSFADRIISENSERAEASLSTLSWVLNGAMLHLKASTIERIQKHVALLSIGNRQGDSIDYDMDTEMLEKQDELLSLLDELTYSAEQFKDHDWRILRKLRKILFNHFADIDIEPLESLLLNEDVSDKELEEFRTMFDLPLRHLFQPEEKIVDFTEVENLLNLCLDEIKRKIQSEANENGLRYALQEYRKRLKDPLDVEKIVEKYSNIIASTCVQTATSNIEVFDYVIVDEAARANPLDLFIPMSRGKKIVLVGDQKQLPHMLNSESAKRLGEDQELLEESFFERMFKLFRENEAGSMIRRTATLKEQFRMHPAIGDFVAENFYQEEGGLRNSEYIDLTPHGLVAYHNKPLVWIDMNRKKGLEQRASTSYIRDCEISEVIQNVNRITEQSDKYTIGIISFYKAQADSIQAKLDKMLNMKDRSRIMVGSVDAFQGREFDVVILSCVRSNFNKEMNKRVGFLNNSNRLNVAFSRAKKLHIVIGDRQTVASDGKNTYIEALEQFARKCESDQGMYLEAVNG